jgi:salicylate hydroxylase
MESRVSSVPPLLRESAVTEDIYEGSGEIGFTAEEMREHLTGMWDPIWHHDLEADIDKAVGWLRENGSFA